MNWSMSLSQCLLLLFFTSNFLTQNTEGHMKDHSNSGSIANKENVNKPENVRVRVKRLLVPRAAAGLDLTIKLNYYLEKACSNFSGPDLINSLGNLLAKADPVNYSDHDVQLILNIIGNVTSTALQLNFKFNVDTVKVIDALKDIFKKKPSPKSLG
ncbi:uncharacterized protein LOC143989115 [Lithobates pipiens]